MKADDEGFFHYIICIVLPFLLSDNFPFLTTPSSFFHLRNYSGLFTSPGWLGLLPSPLKVSNKCVGLPDCPSIGWRPELAMGLAETFGGTPQGRPWEGLVHAALLYSGDAPGEARKTQESSPERGWSQSPELWSVCILRGVSTSVSGIHTLYLLAVG